MARLPSILCDEAELAVDAAAVAEALHLRVAPRAGPQVIEEALEAVARGERVALALCAPPSPEDLVRLADAARVRNRPLAVALLGHGEEAALMRALGSDVGLVMVDDVRPLLAVMALLDEDGDPHHRLPSLRALSRADRVRVGEHPTDASAGRIVREDGSLLGHSAGEGPATALAGEARDVRAALLALQATSTSGRPAMPTVEGVDPQVVLDVILGPPRALSDPASKSVLAAYDLPLPAEELCASPSRAASEAARIGFPVRVALASPDLRVWDHPDLAADGIDNAARVRDVFRQTMALARSRAPDARLLGVTVSATTSPRALLRFRATPMRDGLVLAELGFSDPHGLAADDRTRTVLPVRADTLERVLARLAGSSLLLEGGVADRRRTITELGDVVLRIAALLHDFRSELASVEVDPLAVLVGGGVEVREACVTVGDAFVRSLEQGTLDAGSALESTDP